MSKTPHYILLSFFRGVWWWSITWMNPKITNHIMMKQIWIHEKKYIIYEINGRKCCFRCSSEYVVNVLQKMHDELVVVVVVPYWMLRGPLLMQMLMTRVLGQRSMCIFAYSSEMEGKAWQPFRDWKKNSAITRYLKMLRKSSVAMEQLFRTQN